MQTGWKRGANASKVTSSPSNKGSTGFRAGTRDGDPPDVLLSRIGPELDPFYSLGQIRVSEMREWEKLERAVAELLKSEHATGLRKRMVNRVISPCLRLACFL